MNADQSPAGTPPSTGSAGSGPTLVYLARHGRTALNAAGALRGHIDVPLDEVGRRQARRLGVVLGAKNPSRVVASPLQRAVETARPVASAAGLEVTLDERLTDRGYGQWAGVSAEAVVAQWGSLDDAPGVEPVADVRDRALQALTEIVGRATGAAVVVVAHDAVNRIVLATLDPALGAPDDVPQGTGCFNTLEYQHGWTVVKVNQIPAGDDLP